MRIKSIRIDNFKSLIDFTIELEKFNCIIGLNGSGKSTFLQAVDFLAQLARGDMENWFKERLWHIGDIEFKLEEKQRRQIKFSVDFITDDRCTLTWKGLYNSTRQCCTSEDIIETDGAGNERPLLKVSGGKYSIFITNEKEKTSEMIAFKYTGSIMSQLADKVLKQCKGLTEIRDFMKNVKSFGLLSPGTLKLASKAVGDIGLEGEKFPSFLKTIMAQAHDNVVCDMQQYYPKLCNVAVKDHKGGVKNIVFEEDCGNNGKITFNARHISDGLIRTLAIVAQMYTQRSIVMFDEIENGINPELMETLVHYLINCNIQIVVTTHNPMVLNYIPDDVACRSIAFFYKKDGETKTVKFLSQTKMPEMYKKLKLLGPGEIFIDTDLTKLSDVLAKEGNSK